MDGFLVSILHLSLFSNFSMKKYFFFFFFLLFEIFVAGSGQIALAAASRGYALAVVCRLLIVVASLVMEHGP